MSATLAALGLRLDGLLVELAPAEWPPKPGWTMGCDLGWHDEGIGLLVALPSGRKASACLECLSEALGSGLSREDIIANLEEKVAPR